MADNKPFAHHEDSQKLPSQTGVSKRDGSGLSEDETVHALRRNLQKTTRRIATAARAAGRDPEEITLLPVTKFHPVESISSLADLGATDVAENREQEARDKAEKLPGMRFHMIGQVQTKKANAVARWASSVHSVDSRKLADALDRGIALAIEREQRTEGYALPVFLQYSVDGDTSRGGIQGDALMQLAEHVETLKNVTLAGVMVVPPLDSAAESVFRHARMMCDSLAERVGRRLQLSAGMSADLEKAIAAGSDIVRVGTDIMGPRPVAF